METLPRALRPLLLGIVLVAPRLAQGGESLRSTSNLDGLYISAGPVLAGLHADGAWTSSVGVELSLVRVTERSVPAAMGLAAGGVGYTQRDGGRLWLEAELAIAQALPFAVGLGLGGTVEADPVRPPRWGAQGTVWIMAGVIPYVRVGALPTTGLFVEAGVMLKVPAMRF
ncbi:MAG: hypothetical protein HY698_17105 [Deltaproteobacteria bacterium]|nr:hypothetical protein [Deltaproteobacteria bacterium]